MPLRRTAAAGTTTASSAPSPSAEVAPLRRPSAGRARFLNIWASAAAVKTFLSRNDGGCYAVAPAIPPSLPTQCRRRAEYQGLGCLSRGERRFIMARIQKGGCSAGALGAAGLGGEPRESGRSGHTRCGAARGRGQPPVPSGHCGAGHGVRPRPRAAATLGTDGARGARGAEGAAHGGEGPRRAAPHRRVRGQGRAARARGAVRLAWDLCLERSARPPRSEGRQQGRGGPGKQAGCNITIIKIAFSVPMLYMSC